VELSDLLKTIHKVRTVRYSSNKLIECLIGVPPRQL